MSRDDQTNISGEPQDAPRDRPPRVREMSRAQRPPVRRWLDRGSSD